MTDFHAQFGELRSQLQKKPSRKLMRRIIHVLELCPEEELPGFLPYILGYLDHWPDRERRMPPLYMKQMTKGETNPLSQLFRSINFNNLYDNSIVRALQNPDMQHIRELHINTPNTSRVEAIFNELNTQPQCAQMRGLYFYENTISYNPNAFRVMWHGPYAEIRTIVIEKGMAEGVFRMLRRGDCQKLEKLVLKHSYLATFNHWLELSASDWPNLKHLSWTGQQTSYEHGLAKLINRMPDTIRTVEWTHAEALDVEEIREVLQDPRRHHIESLNLTGNNMHTEHIVELLNQPWPNLKHLYLTSNAIGTLGVEALATTPNLPSLETLKLSPKFVGGKAQQFIELSSTLSDDIKENWRIA